MNSFILFLRGVNVGKSVRVKMAELKERLQEIGCADVFTYINSGNVIFDSDFSRDELMKRISAMLEESFAEGIGFVLLKAQDLADEARSLPDWWKEDLARKDVLFYTGQADRDKMKESILNMKLCNEIVHFGKTAVFWGKYDEKDFLKTAYHKQLIKEKYYKQITIRNGNTFEKMAELSMERLCTSP